VAMSGGSAAQVREQLHDSARSLTKYVVGLLVNGHDASRGALPSSPPIATSTPTANPWGMHFLGGRPVGGGW
jgi:hypothetical protein